MLAAIGFYLLIGLLTSFEIGFSDWRGYVLYTIFWCPVMIGGLFFLSLEVINYFKNKGKGDDDAKS